MDYGRLFQVPGATRDRLGRLASNSADPLDQLWACPWKLLESPDPWQKDVLARRQDDHLLNCSRQSGKTTVVAAQCVDAALTCGSFCLVISASQRQSIEFMERVWACYYRMPLVALSEEPKKSEMRLVNGARVLALPCSEATARGFSAVDRLVFDEASRIPDQIFGALRPMLAVSHGRMTVLSTPYGKRGFFWQEWTQGTGWNRKLVPWTQCPRISPEFIEDERRKHGDAWVEQEYNCEFINAVSSVFDPDDFAVLVDESMEGTW